MWPRGLGGREKYLKWHVIHQNGQNLKCSSLGCVFKLWGEGCGYQGVWPREVWPEGVWLSGGAGGAKKS